MTQRLPTCLVFALGAKVSATLQPRIPNLHGQVAASNNGGHEQRGDAGVAELDEVIAENAHDSLPKSNPAGQRVDSSWSAL